MNHRLQLLVGAGVIVLAGLVALGALDIPSAAGYGGVGPNFLPWLVAAGLLLTGGFLAWEASSGGFREMPEPEGAEHADWIGFAWVSAGILSNAALITTLGFILSCALCFVLAVRGFKWSEGRTDLRPGTLALDALVGVAISAPVYWLFTKGLAINLPGLTQSGWL